MYPKIRLALALLILTVAALLPNAAHAQQTLGGIVGTVTDPTGSVVPNVAVTVVGEGTNLTRTAQTSSSGAYALPNLPIGSYTVTFALQGFSSERFPGIVIQADRTVTLPAQLKLGSVSDNVTVEATPLLNATDTTNGYVLDKAQIEAIPLPTGSFTGVAILSPGVNAELSGAPAPTPASATPPSGPMASATPPTLSHSTAFDASNLFNGKSTSQVGSARVVNSTGVSSSNGAAGVIQSAASIYLSIGNAIPTPALRPLKKSASTLPCTTPSRVPPRARTSTSAPPLEPTLTTALSTATAAPTPSTLPPSSSKTTTTFPPAQEPRPPPLRRRRNRRRPHRQGQALRLRRLPAPPSLRSGDRLLLPRRPRRPLRHHPRRRLLRQHHQRPVLPHRRRSGWRLLPPRRLQHR